MKDTLYGQYVVHILYMCIHAWFYATYAFAFAHACDTRILFKL